MNLRNFDQQVILITGAAGGLGAALCHAFAAQGAQIVALDLHLSALEQLATDLPTACLPIAADITDEAACNAAVAQAVAHFGRLDGLINNAGISARSLFLDTAPSVARRVMAVNYFGSLQMTHAALPHLIASRGMVVAISSVAGFAPLFGRTAYSASKHALHGFFDSLRSEVEAQGVLVSVICPSFIQTGIASAALTGKGEAVGTVQTAQRITAGGESQPADIAAKIVRALQRNQTSLRPDRTARLAWWVSKLAPRFYARTMRRKVAGEFLPPSSKG